MTTGHKISLPTDRVMTYKEASELPVARQTLSMSFGLVEFLLTLPCDGQATWFMSYYRDVYLKSDEWKNLRLLALMRAR